MSAIGEKRNAEHEPTFNKKSKIESRNEQKSTRWERKSHDKNFEMIVQAKKVWEQLRRGDISRDEQKALMAKMMSIIGGKVQDVIFKHDASRMIQTCLKKGNAEQRNQIAEELKGKYVELSKSMYGKFIVMKAIEYCHKQRDNILREFRNNVRKLIRHKEASTVIETFYSQYANAAQRHELLAEFYGPEMTLFSNGGGAKTLDDLLAAFPDKKEPVLKHMAEMLRGCLDKGTITNSIVHKALYQYMTLADDKGREEMMGHLKESLQEIVHTREGAWVAMICLSIAAPKDRKNIIKAFKPFLVKIASDEYGYLVLLRLLDVTDDTVLVSKAVLGELSKHATELFADKFGRRFFMYILAGRNTRYLSPETVQLLKEGDKIRVSKKEPEIRAQEILKATSPQLIKLVTENAAILMREKLSSQVVQEIMLHAVGDKSAAMDAILALAGENIEKENHIIEDRFANRIVKAMIKADTAESENDKAVEPLEFAPKLLEVIKPHLGHFATNHGSFIVLALAEEPATKKEVKKALKPFKKDIEAAAAEGNAGSKVLLSHL
ncbi:Mitochondrial import inner membrane translocase subunit tim8 [Mucor velutinosus]|uniref:Mitochondrial import inner membrane translocase subunit tim8 n=1 Tax=Mucor velutinosus TaxID=708070 RepID=A0AAN7D8A6_9FUNG|nr:Mitochondrial import inner membrane translocase subunit tim8 [Mucor velutinosus]